ncbi:MAG: hypothetical protein NZ455_15135 [Bacteroidia bacterium]|nr:hypothetical protein [Bacteroidia bacterium]
MYLLAFRYAHASKVGVLQVVLRTAHTLSAHLTQQYFAVLPCLYICVCFILFNIHYQSFTRLKFFTLF